MCPTAFKTATFATLLAGLAAGAPAAAQTLNDFLTERTELHTETELTLDVMGNVAGGQARGTRAPAKLDLIGVLDTAEKKLWRGGKFKVYVLGTYGSNPGDLVGDDQGVDNIAAPATLKIFELWYQQEWLNDRASALFGLHDYNSEFQVLNHSGIFLNSSFGLSRELSQAGVSTYPTTALALRLAYRGVDGGYVRGAAYDGIPGDPGEEDGTHIILKHSDGLFYGLESGIQHGDDIRLPGYYKLALGACRQTTDRSGQPTFSYGTARGAYLLAERSFTKRVGAFLKVGKTLGEINRVDEFYAAGLTTMGLVHPDREDVLGFGLAHAHHSDAFLAANPGAATGETALELAYAYPVSRKLSVHPDIQYIIDPGMDPALDNALVIGVRVKFEL